MKDTINFNKVMIKLREFFQKERGFVEVPAQSRLSILAACEDPDTITTFKFGDLEYPLPQTGQMWLEKEILSDPSAPGYFCQTTSYRFEKKQIEGRHEKIFPMFEFETGGGFDDLMKLENELCSFLGFKDKSTVLVYDDMSEKYDTEILEANHETQIQNEYGNVAMLTKFPHRSSPFWNMRQNENGTYNKIDVLLHGMETIGSAERSCNPNQMRESFYTVSKGAYAEKLFSLFGRERVETELDEYLELPMIPRFGAGIGITRLVRAMQLEGLL